MRRAAALVALFWLSAAFGLWAQDTGTGLPAFGSLSSFGFDTVNNQNLNVLFSIPLVSSAGRGMPLTLPLTNNSQIWRVSGAYWVPVVDQAGNPTWGWQKETALGGIVKYTSSTSNFKCLPGTQFYPVTFYSNYVYIDATGTSHPAGDISFRRSDLCASQNYGTYSAYASDDTGLFISDYNGGSPSVKSPRGDLVNSVSTAQDTNGNYITRTVVNSTETDYTDSIGNVALKIIYTPNSTNPTEIDYKFLDNTGVYQTIKLSFSSFNIKTNFGCSGVSEYNATGVNLPIKLDIPTPGGTSLEYLFSYEATPQHSGYYTGRIKTVTLPTGGYYEYDYGSNNDGINCSDGTTVNMNRTVSDGTNSKTWSFVRNAASRTTTVTTPALADTSAANDTIYTFDGTGKETSRKIYADSPGTNLLRTVNTTWLNGTPSTQVTILEDNSTQSEVDTSFDSNGLLDSMSEYDFGSGTRGSLLRTTTYSYLSSSPYTSRNIINLITSKVIKDGSGAVQYRQDLTYDGVALASCPTGVPQHDDVSYPCSMNYRGNPTSVTTYLDPSALLNPITKNFTYDWFGNLLTGQPDCCQSETFSYSSATEYSQPDSITRGGGPTLTTSYTYNAYTQQLATSTDENGQVTHYYYDFLRRPTSVTRPDGSTVSSSYDDVNFTNTLQTPIDSSHAAKKITSLDTLGRPILVTLEDATSQVYSKVSTNYDFAGRAYKTSNPYTSSPAYWTTTSFDSLGRATQVTLPDNSKTTYSYTDQTVTVTDPAGKQRESAVDGVGRLASVSEPDDNGGLNLQTSYAYTVLDKLATVTQDQQTRTYGYDALGRLTSFAIPETLEAATRFTYDNYGDVLTRTDPRGVVTNYGYDGLNRPSTVSYTIPQGSGVAATPNLSYTYGTNAAQFNNGRLITMSDGVGSENYTYNDMGEVTQVQKVITGTTYTTGYQHNQAGQITQITYPSGRAVLQNTDPLGRLCSVGASGSTCSSGTLYASGFGYNAAQQLTGFNYGNGVVASFGYSSDRLQLTSLSYAKSGNTLFSLTYGYAQPNGVNNGQVTGITDNVDNGRSVTFQYDPMERLKNAATTGSANYPQWGLGWVYDRYGSRQQQNVTAGQAPAPQTPTDPTSNRMNTSGYSYDDSGNLTNDGQNTLTYDGESRIATSTGTGSGTYSYDGNGLRVKRVSGGTTTVYIFAGSRVIAEYENGASPSSPTREYIYSAGALLAKVEAGSTVYYHPDSLSTRLITNSSGTVIGQQGHYPYGEQWYAQNTTTKWFFTTYERDAESGNDYALARYYVNRVGRFSAIDPLAGDAGNPQSLNRYAYAMNDPVNRIDPTGLCGLAVDYEYVGTNWGGGGTVSAVISYTSCAMYENFLTMFFDNFQGGPDLGAVGPVDVLNRAEREALSALLNNADCATAVDNGTGIAASTLEANLAASDPTGNPFENVQSFGTIALSDLPPTMGGYTSTQNEIYANGGAAVAGWTSTITMNSLPGGVFMSPGAYMKNWGALSQVMGVSTDGLASGTGYSDWIMQTIELLHEMGHGSANYFASSAIIPDAGNGALSQQNTLTIENNCYPQGDFGGTQTGAVPAYRGSQKKF
jgi:RHS repeat-associated protein